MRGALAACASIVLLAGCGGASRPPAQTGESAKTVFTRQCGACHRLADAGAQGTVAVDLDELRPSRERVLRAIADGPSSMPAGLVTGADADAVAAYVASATRR